MPGTGSVNTAVDLDEGLKYLSGLLGLPAPGDVQPPFPLVNARSAAAAQPPRSPSPVLATVTNRCCRCAGLYTYPLAVRASLAMLALAVVLD
jgi:hypothetical protein